jgi:hypothetical protein
MASVTISTQNPTTVTTTYAVTTGSLPSGMTLNASTGVISGTPSTVGYSVSGVDSTFSITATNNLGVATVKSYTITRRWNDGSSATYAAPNALAIKALTSTTTIGYYWIKPTDYSTALQVHCDMSNSGGGWMLMSFCGTDHPNGRHVDDPQFEYPFNMDSASTSITNTAQAAGRVGNIGQEFIDQLVINGRTRAIGLFRIRNSGGTFINYHLLCDSTARWLPVATRCSIDAERRGYAGNTWLKTSWPTYTADSGNNGVGTLSGTTNGHNNEAWPIYPGNMAINNGENWGYAIGNQYADGGGRGWGRSDWSSCHSGGWNRPGSFWLKVA